MEQNVPEHKPKVILCVAAHPDDLEFGVSGSVAAWTKAGVEVHYLICTDGSKGSDDVHISSSDLTAIRRAEQRAAAEILGVKTVTFLDYEDGITQASAELKRDIAREIRRHKPDTVVTMDPLFVYSSKLGIINHSDHRNVGLAAIDAVYPLARDHLSFPELALDGFAPHNVRDVLLMGFGEGEFYVDITDTYETKLKALAAHKSQVDIEAVKPWLIQMAGRYQDASGFELAEAFIRIHMRL